MQDLSKSLQSTADTIQDLYISLDPYRGQPFKDYRLLVSAGQPESPWQWRVEVPGEAPTLHAVLNDQHAVQLLAKPPPTGRPGQPVITKQPITEEPLPALITFVQTEVSKAAEAFIVNLQSRFPKQAELEALAPAYPHYHMQVHSTAEKNQHLQALAKLYGDAKVLQDGTEVAAMLDSELLTQQAPAFYYAAETAARSADEAHLKEVRAAEAAKGSKKMKVTPRTVFFWRMLQARGPAVIQRYSEWTKVGLIALGMACGSVSDERLFSLMNLLCGELRNSLTTHLEMCCRFHSGHLPI